MRIAARGWHGVVALIGLVSLEAQVIALINGENYSLLGPAMSWWNFFSYFTILSNILVLMINLDLARNPEGRQSTLWRVLRLNLVPVPVCGSEAHRSARGPDQLRVHWCHVRGLWLFSSANR
ncbi:hypothetical protein [Arthrobacter sp. TB 23]|uniref:hypothetical protein n=1 Tax=Arthrobacter sp. TB 23 TaxID=494419 RepID=UPI0002FBDDFC|nr:hypothetical protein [Arthrobacter sp. TB 23]